MSFTVTNLSNDLAKNNTVYFSNKNTPNPASIIKVRVNDKILKAGFLPDLEKTNVAMSKNYRDFIGTDVGKSVRVEQLPPVFDE